MFKFHALFRRPIKSGVKCLAGLLVLGVAISWLLLADNGSAGLGDTPGVSPRHYLPPAKIQVEGVSNISESSAFTFSSAFENDVRHQKDVIIYNRVPKCASTSTRMTFHMALGARKVNVHVSKVYAQEYLNETGQRIFIEQLNRLSKPLVFIRHVFFVDFTKFGFPQPIYINMIRDPLERLVSDYYFKRYNLGHMFPMPEERRDRTYNECVQGNHSECVEDGPRGYFRIIPYFCGMDKRCRHPSDWSLKQAKHNVEKYFLAVGTTEHVAKFLELLERLMPQYFTGVLETYVRGGKRLKKMAKTSKKDPIDERTAEIMKEKLRYDYDFYRFIQQRFQSQYTKIVNGQFINS